MASYNATYNYLIKPTTSQQYWKDSVLPKPVPPPLTKAPGRPKKQIRNDGYEDLIRGYKFKRSYNE